MAAELLRDLSRATDANNDPLPGATWEFYDSGTLTPRAVFADAEKAISLGSVVTADAGGRFAPIYMNAAYAYRGIQKSASGTVIQDIDPVNDSALADVVAGFEVLKVDVSTGNVGIGTAPLDSKFTVQTATSFTGNAQHIYHYAQQSDDQNQTSPLAIHNYTDGVSQIIDTVGIGISLTIRQAENDSARPGFGVGSGPFLDFQRSTGTGLSDGNLGSGNDRLAFFNARANLCFYGVEADDWDGNANTAPIQIGDYSGFLSRKLYFGYNSAPGAGVIGVIDGGEGVFKFLDLAASAVRPIGDNAVGLGAASLRFTEVRAIKSFVGSGTCIQTGTGSPAGVVSGNRGDIFLRTDGGTGTTFYVKEDNDGTVNGWVAK